MHAPTIVGEVVFVLSVFSSVEGQESLMVVEELC